MYGIPETKIVLMTGGRSNELEHKLEVQKKKKHPYARVKRDGGWGEKKKVTDEQREGEENMRGGGK